MIVVPDRSSTRRRWLWKNGHRKCAYCERRLTWRGKHMLTADHIIPKSKGGTDKRKNLVASCNQCNQSKGNKAWVTPANVGGPA